MQKPPTADKDTAHTHTRFKFRLKSGQSLHSMKKNRGPHLDYMEIKKGVVCTNRGAWDVKTKS